MPEVHGGRGSGGGRGRLARARGGTPIHQQVPLLALDALPIAIVDSGCSISDEAQSVKFPDLEALESEAGCPGSASASPQLPDNDDGLGDSVQAGNPLDDSGDVASSGGFELGESLVQRPLRLVRSSITISGR
jgi:hypothetical protein